jgi:hypothetical protein
VSDNLHPIFHAFPNVTTLACPSILAGSDALRPAIECFPYLDALVGLRIYRHTAGQKLEFDALSIAGQYPWISTRRHTHPLQNSHAISRACACCASRIPYHTMTRFDLRSAGVRRECVLISHGVAATQPRAPPSLHPSQRAHVFRPERQKHLPARGAARMRHGHPEGVDESRRKGAQGVER